MPAITGLMLAPVDDWAEATDGVSKAIVLDVQPASAMAGGVFLRFADAKPAETEVTGHILMTGPHAVLPAIDLTLTTGKVWVRSMSATYPAQLFRTTFV